MSPGPTEARVREVMRVQGLDYRAACAWLGRRGAERRNARRRFAAERLTRVRRTWAWARDFE